MIVDTKGTGREENDTVLAPVYRPTVTGQNSIILPPKHLFQISNSDRCRYEGEWEDGFRSGQGMLETTKGDIFEVFFSNYYDTKIQKKSDLLGNLE